MAQGEVYPLDRYAGETARLNAQNKLLNDAVGYHLHPSIKRTLPPEPRIADIATGTGAFLIDLSHELPPGSQLHGYDITDVAFPPAAELPTNVKLTVSDCKQSPPSELQGRYDVVCIRFLNAALLPEDWELVAQHIVKLLKPGGALQWIEGNFRQLASVYQSQHDTETAAIDQAVARALPDLENADWFVTHLRGVLESVGFGDVRQKVMSTDRVMESRGPISAVAIGALYSILRRQASGGHDTVLPIKEVEKLKKEMDAEIKNGAYMRADMHQFLAIKKA